MRTTKNNLIGKSLGGFVLLLSLACLTSCVSEDETARATEEEIETSREEMVKGDSVELPPPVDFSQEEVQVLPPFEEEAEEKEEEKPKIIIIDDYEEGEVLDESMFLKEDIVEVNMDEVKDQEPISKQVDPSPNDFIVLDEEVTVLNLDEVKRLIGYPQKAQEEEIEGKVILRILVGTEGNYEKHIVLKDPHPVLTEAVEEHIEKLKFTPGKHGGKPVKAWTSIPFNFILYK